MAQQQTNKDTRPRVGVYGIVRGDKDTLAHGLAVGFCLESGWRPVEYVDESFPCDGQPSEWARLMGDIAKGQLYGVVVRWEVKGLLNYCEQHNTKLCVLDKVFELMPALSKGRRVSLL